MLVISEKRYFPSTVNTIVLSKNDLYYYVHRDVYDQSVVLSDRHNLESLSTVIGIKEEGTEIVSWFYENAPSPINILAPYLYLVEGEISKDMEECCGVLHSITAVINVRRFITQPAELRKSVTFSLSIKEEYELAWERFFMEAIPYESRNYMSTPTSNYSYQNNDYSQQEEEEWTEVSPGVKYNNITGQTVYEDNEDEDADFLASLMEEPEEVEEETNKVETSEFVSEEEKEATKKLLYL